MSIIINSTSPPLTQAPFYSAQITKPFSKFQNAATFVVDLANDLGPTENIASFTPMGVSPSTLHTLTLINSSFATKTITLDVSGGDPEISYGVMFSVVTDQGRTLSVTAAISIVSDPTSDLVTRNEFAFQSLQGDITVGTSGIGKTIFAMPPGSPTSGGYILWELLNTEGTLHARGNCHEIVVHSTSFITTVEGTAVIHVPSTVPPTLVGQSYQIRWALVVPNQSNTYNFENISILGETTAPIGAQDAVELRGDLARMELILPKAYSRVGWEVFAGNTPVGSYQERVTTARVSSGWLYQAEVDTASLSASLDPYSFIWKASDPGRPAERATAKLFVLNPSLLQAMSDMQACVMKQRRTLRDDTALMFPPDVVLTWLRRGRDFFNAAGGIMTAFDMSYATGGLREFWLRYAEVAALRAQYLAEGESAFTFNGGEITLDVDHAPYYEALAKEIERGLEEVVKDLKNYLIRSGINGGDGNVTGVGNGNGIAVVGMSLSPVSRNFPGSPLRRFIP